LNALVVFYSRTGTNRLIAERISDLLESDLEEVIDKKNRKGFIGYIVAGRDSMKKSLAEIHEIQKDISQYDLIVIGGPNWVGEMTPAIRSFLNQNKGKFNKVAFFSVSGSGEAQRAFTEMKSILIKNPVAELELQTEEVKKNKFEEKVKKFVEEIN
jgi:flavodoxin